MQLDPALVYQAGEQLAGVVYFRSQAFAQDVRALVCPALVAGGAGVHQPPGADGLRWLDVVAGCHWPPVASTANFRRKATTPLVACSMN